MAPKRPPTPEEDPPSASSSSSSADDDEEDHHQQQPPSTSAGEDSDKDPPPPQQQPPIKLSPPPPKPKPSSSKKPEPELEPKTLKVKPLEETKKPKPKTTTTTTTGADRAKKKPETKAVNESKKSNKKKDPEPENESETEPGKGELAVPLDVSDKKSGDTKKLLFQRLWSEEDEIAVLRGIIEFKEEKGVDPAKEMGSFFEFIKSSLHFDVSLAQLKDKVWRLKRKFEKGVKRGSKGEDKTFSKEHDQLGFDLSKRIWGSERIELRGKNSNVVFSVKRSNVADNHKKGSNNSGNNKNRMVKRVKIEKSNDRVRGGMEEFVRKEGLDLMEGEKRMEMEEKWRELDVAELELFLKRNELVREQAKLMLASYDTEDD